MPSSLKRLRAQAPAPEAPDARQQARLLPNVVRALLALADERGVSGEALCRGLGFTACDLRDPALRLSHNQTRAFILRAQAQMPDPALGLAAGARQTPLSWGLTGLLMMTSATYGDAILHGLAHQSAAGAMVEHRLEEVDGEIHLVLVPHLVDLAIERFLVEVSLSCMVAVSRSLMRLDRNPLWVSVPYAAPACADAYRAFFRCPVHFDAADVRLALSPALLELPVPGYERLNCEPLSRMLANLLPLAGERPDLVASVSHRLRTSSEEPPALRDMAQLVNISDRTLRRRLSSHQTSYRALRDNARYDQARELLANSTLTIAEVAAAVGYSDARAFRRAFQRWSGQLPTDFRRTC